VFAVSNRLLKLTTEMKQALTPQFAAPITANRCKSKTNTQ